MFCPKCHSSITVTHGYYGKGRKRFKCKICGKTFSETANTPFYRMKEKNEEKIIEAVISAFKKKNIRITAKKYGVQPYTLYQWINRLNDKRYIDSISKRIEEESKIHHLLFSKEEFFSWLKKKSPLTCDHRRKWKKFM